VLLRVNPGWRLEHVRRVIVPLGGKGEHDILRARLLGSPHRVSAPSVTFVRVLGDGVQRQAEMQARRELLRVALDECPGPSSVEVLHGDNLVDALLGYVAKDDLVIAGLQRVRRKQSAFGPVAAALARRTGFPLIMISRRL
jgi:nucleotide-binding universal stress UspA family protein